MKYKIFMVVASNRGSRGLKSINRVSMLLIAFSVLMLVGARSIQAQNQPLIQWQQSFGGTNDEGLSILKQTTDGGYILGGPSKSGASGNKTGTNYGRDDYWIIKIDGSGNKAWENSFGGTNSDILASLQQTSDGGYILGGTSLSVVSGNKTNAGAFEHAWLVKTDVNGSKAWEASFGGLGQNKLSYLQQTIDGGYILGGYSDSSPGPFGNKTSANYGGYDYWVVKTDASGAKVWEQSFGGNQEDDLTILQQTSDGSYILGGYSRSGVSGNKTSTNYGGFDYWVVKIDGNGNKLWEKSFGGSVNDGISSLQQTSDGGYILGGYSSSGISGNKTSNSYGLTDYWLVKIDGNGNKVWENVFGGSGDDYLKSLQQTSDGGYILGGDSPSGISGSKTSTNNGGNDFWVVKIDENGNKVWEKSLGGSNNDGLLSVQQTSDGGYIVGGYSRSAVSGNKTITNYGGSDFWIIKLEELPFLQTARTGESLLLSWSQFFPGYSLQQSSNLISNSWANVSQTMSTNNGLISVSMPIDPEPRFFRLVK